MTDQIFHPENLDWDDFIKSMAEGTSSLSSVEAKADVYLEALANLERESKGDRAVAAERIDQITRWLQKVEERRARRAEWLTGQLAELAERIDYGSKKSKDLPHGVIGFRAKRATVEILDKKMAEAWAATECPEALKERASTSLTKTEIIDLVRTRGIHLDPATSGMRFIDDHDELYITPNTKD